MSTASYLAGFETNAVEVSYGLETTWGVAPATTFQAIRLTGESLSEKKQRSRPDELNVSAQVSDAVTQQITADGGINFALSYGVYDDMFSSLLNSAWAGLSTAIVSAAADITFAAAGNTVTSTTSGKFTSVIIGQWVRINTPGANNNVYGRVATKPNNQTLTLSGCTLVNETPAGATGSIKSSGYIRNSNVFQSLFFQKKFASNIFLTYPGTQVTGCTINANQGQFAEGSFTVMSKGENKATVDSSTGGVIAAPAFNVFDTVAEFAQLQLGGVAIAGVCKGISLQMTKQGAAMDYGLTSASAQGTRIGKFQLDGGKATMFFKDFTLYDLYKAETKQVISYRQTDLSGNSYVFTVDGAVLMNPTVVAQAANGAVLADFTLEGNTSTSFATVQFDRILA